MVGLINGHIRKNLTQNGEPQNRTGNEEEEEEASTNFPIPVGGGRNDDNDTHDDTVGAGHDFVMSITGDDTVCVSPLDRLHHYRSPRLCSDRSNSVTISSCRPPRWPSS